MFCLGKGCYPIQEYWAKSQAPVELFLNRQALLESLREHLKAGDVVLLKGSRANLLWKVIEEL